MDNTESPSGSGYQQPEQSGSEDSFQLKVQKFKGENRCKIVMDINSASAGLTAIMLVITKYAEMTGLTIYKVLSLLTVALLNPAIRKEEQQHD